MTDTTFAPTIRQRHQRTLEWVANVLFDVAGAVEWLARIVEDKALRGRFEARP